MHQWDGWITAFKYFIYGIYFIRMLLVAFITAITPILIVINAIGKIRGKKGILKKWFDLYLYLIFIKPVIGIMYYLLVTNCSNLVRKIPFYIGPVIILIILTVIISFKRIAFDGFFKKT